MGFTIFMTCWRDGLPAHFEPAMLDESFRGYIERRQDRSVLVDFGDGCGAELSWDFDDRSGSDIHTLAIDRPGGDDLFDKIVELMRWTGSAVYWPGETPCLSVPNAGVVRHLPLDMVESLGPPIIVDTGADLIRAIERS